MCCCRYRLCDEKSRAVICRYITEAMFSTTSQNTHIALARMTAPLAAIFGHRFSSRSMEKITVICVRLFRVFLVAPLVQLNSGCRYVNKLVF